MKNKAFTLVELLIVVLIIGILAAIAVPQYQKAVLKSRFAEWITYVNGYSKAVDLWLLQNGMPMTKVVEFSGTAAYSGREFAPLDLDFNCPINVPNYPNVCGTKIGTFHVGCSDHCWINLGTIAGGTPVMKYGEYLYVGRNYPDLNNDEWVLNEVPTSTDKRKIVCELWQSHFGLNRMTDEVKESCAEIGVN